MAEFVTMEALETTSNVCDFGTERGRMIAAAGWH
jgi:hypothetical protein